MRRAVGTTLALTGFLLSVGPASAGKIQGTVYNLPTAGVPVSPTTDDVVEVRVFATIVGPDGELLPKIGGRPGEFENGDLIGFGRSNQMTGGYDIDVPPVGGQPVRIVNIEFRRENATTRVLPGVVVDDNRKTPNLIDVNVPRPKFPVLVCPPYCPVFEPCQPMYLRACPGTVGRRTFCR